MKNSPFSVCRSNASIGFKDTSARLSECDSRFCQISASFQEYASQPLAHVRTCSGSSVSDWLLWKRMWAAGVSSIVADRKIFDRLLDWELERQGEVTNGQECRRCCQDACKGVSSSTSLDSENRLRGRRLWLVARASSGWQNSISQHSEKWIQVCRANFTFSAHVESRLSATSEMRGRVGCRGWFLFLRCETKSGDTLTTSTNFPMISFITGEASTSTQVISEVVETCSSSWPAKTWWWVSPRGMSGKPSKCAKLLDWFATKCERWSCSSVDAFARWRQGHNDCNQVLVMSSSARLDWRNWLPINCRPSIDKWTSSLAVWYRMERNQWWTGASAQLHRHARRRVSIH